jgi:hypothetical protein
MRLIVFSALAKLFIGQGRCIAQEAVLLMNENRIWRADRNSLDAVYTSSQLETTIPSPRQSNSKAVEQEQEITSNY